MIKLHPAIVHFPVALLSIAALFAAISLFIKKDFFKELAFWNLFFGVIGAIAAVFTGLWEEQNLAHNDEIHRVLVKHKFTGISILTLSFALLTWSWLRKNKFGKTEHISWVLFLVIGAAMIFYQGYLGGKMVYDQGAGVRPMELQMEKEADTTKPHSHSGSGLDHNTAQDSAATDNTTMDKSQHAHPSTRHRSQQSDTMQKQDPKEVKEKKKELKDMKY